MRTAALALLFLAVAIGSTVQQAQLEAWPQAVLLVVASLPLLGRLLRQDKAFERSWLLLFSIAVLQA
jgi:hypothetical protein